MDLYAENILDHYKHPRNAGSLPQPTVRRQEKNLSCGDDLTVDLLIEDDVITEVRWNGNGCAISQAAMSLLSEELAGTTAKDGEALRKEDVLKLLGVPVGARRMKCALLGLHAVKNALKVARGASEETWLQTVEIDK